MNRTSQKEARLEAGGGPVIIDLRDRVLSMDNAALASLHANAQRLHSSGESKQRLAAADLLPVIEAELARRAALKSPRSASKAAAAKKATKAKAVKVEQDDEDDEE
jgi:hypothetical protein